MQVKITQVGNSLGVIVPKDVLQKLNVTKGDTLELQETPDGVMLTPYDPAFAEQMEAAEDIFKRYRNTLRELAK